VFFNTLTPPPLHSRHPFHPAVPLYRHPTVAPSHRPTVPPSRRPVIPLSRRPAVPPSRRPAVPPSRRPGPRPSPDDLPRKCSTCSQLSERSVPAAWAGLCRPRCRFPAFCRTIRQLSLTGTIAFRWSHRTCIPLWFQCSPLTFISNCDLLVFHLGALTFHGSCRIVPQGLVVRFGLGLDAPCKIKSNQKTEGHCVAFAQQGGGCCDMTRIQRHRACGSAAAE